VRFIGLTSSTRFGNIAASPPSNDFPLYAGWSKHRRQRRARIKGLSGAKLGNPISALAFGEAAVVAKRRWPSWDLCSTARKAAMGGNKFKAKHRPGHQAGPRRLFHASKNKRSSTPTGLVARFGAKLMIVLEYERKLNWKRQPPCPMSPDQNSTGAPRNPRSALGRGRILPTYWAQSPDAASPVGVFRPPGARAMARAAPARFNSQSLTNERKFIWRLRPSRHVRQKTVSRTFRKERSRQPSQQLAHG